jgi:hypothetical protein
MNDKISAIRKGALNRIIHHLPHPIIGTVIFSLLRKLYVPNPSYQPGFRKARCVVAPILELSVARFVRLPGACGIQIRFSDQPGSIDNKALRIASKSLEMAMCRKATPRSGGSSASPQPTL